MPRFDVQQALKDGHTEEEIQAYLKSKGVDVNGNPIKKPSTVERVSDVILNNPASQLAKWFLEPATDLARDAGGQMGMIQAIANKAVLPESLEKTKLGTLATQGLAEKSYNLITPEGKEAYFTTDEQGNLDTRDDPVPALKMGLKHGVGNASYAIPGSGLLPKAGGKLVGPAVRVLDRAILGTGEGLLREAGEENATLESTLESGMGSGVASGALGTVGEIGKPIMKFAGNVIPERMANKIMLRKSFAETEQEIERELRSEYERITTGKLGEEYKRLGAQMLEAGGLKNSMKKVYFNAETERRKLWSEEMEPILKKYADEPMPVSALRAPLLELKDSMKIGFRDEEAAKAVDEVLADIDKWVVEYGQGVPKGKMSVADMDTLPLRFLDEVKKKEDGIFEGVYRGKRDPELLPLNKRVQLTALSAIREVVNTKVPGLKSANTRYGMWSGVQESANNILAKQANIPLISRTPITVPLLFIAAGTGSTAIGDGWADMFGGNLMTLGGALLIGKAMQSSTPALTTANLMNKVGTKGVSAINKIDEPAQKGIRSLTQFLMGSQQ